MTRQNRNQNITRRFWGDTGKHYQTSCLTLYALIDSSFWFEIISLGEFIVYSEGSKVIISKYNCISFSEYCFSVDPDEMPHDVAFQLCLHCLWVTSI